MSHFDAQAFQEREQVVNRLIGGRATFVKGLREAAVAHRSDEPMRDGAAPMHQSASESKAHRSIFNPLHFFLQLGCEGQKALREILGRKKGSS
jgi:hypothetical protein